MNVIPLHQNHWKNSNVQAFWGEIAPCDHVVQLYENDKCFLETLEGFAGCGLLSGDTVVIIATQKHIEELNERLVKHGFDLEKLKAEGQYMPLDAVETLSSFQVNNWPDEMLFNAHISQVLDRAKKGGRKVRAFGEMVALLWEQGHYGATVQLERLWEHLHSKEALTLFCAYPQSGFTQDANESLTHICKTHTKIISGEAGPSTEIYYKTA